MSLLSLVCVYLCSCVSAFSTKVLGESLFLKASIQIKGVILKQYYSKFSIVSKYSKFLLEHY